MDPNEMVEVYVLRNPGKVAIVKLLLEREGIPFFVDGEEQASFTGVLKMRVMVPTAEAERARQLIMDHEP